MLHITVCIESRGDNAPHLMLVNATYDEHRDKMMLMPTLFPTFPHCSAQLLTTQMSKFLAKLDCLARGDLVGASHINTSGAGPRPSALQELMGDLPEAQETCEEGGKPASSSKGSKGSGGREQQQQQQQSQQQQPAAQAHGGARRPAALPRTAHIQEALRITISELFSRMPGAKCANCGASNPALKRQGCSKLFKQYSRKALVANALRGLDVASLVGAGARVGAATLADATAAVEAATTAAASARKRRRDGDSDGVSDDGNDDGVDAKKGPGQSLNASPYMDAAEVKAARTTAKWQEGETVSSNVQQNV
jgi:hypothetical protein